MKKLTYLLMVFVLGTNLAHAKSVTLIVAQEVAENFYKQNSKQIISNVSLAYLETTSEGEAVFYAFNINENGGFVIVTADDNARPIIGYSTQGQFVYPKAKTNIAYWLNIRKNEIMDMRKNNSLANEEITHEWKTYSTCTNSQNTRSLMAVAPLIQTTWDQGQYYNTLCPSNSLTGCGATAMAQIMKFWNYPTTGIGSSSYCDCTSGGFASNYGTLSADYGTATYNWSNMPLNVSSANNDVATIMYHCGVSIQTDYSPNGSYSYMLSMENPTACSQIAYVDYFKYDPSTLQGLYKSDYTNSDWTALLKNDLDIGRPIHYFGTEAQGGHFWVCDGYDSNNNFHFNWGWSGSDDGYFALNNLTTGSGSYTYNPVDEQSVLIGIQPIGSGTTGLEVKNSSGELSIYPNPASSTLTITGNNHHGKIHFALYDVTGREVKTDEINETEGAFNETIAINNLSNGMYILKASDEKNVWIKKLEVK